VQKDAGFTVSWKYWRGDWQCSLTPHPRPLSPRRGEGGEGDFRPDGENFNAIGLPPDRWSAAWCLFLWEFSHDDIDGTAAGAEGAIEFAGEGGCGGLSVELCEFFEIDVPGIIAGGLNEFAMSFCEEAEEFVGFVAGNGAVRGSGVEGGAKQVLIGACSGKILKLGSGMRGGWRGGFWCRLRRRRGGRGGRKGSGTTATNAESEQQSCEQDHGGDDGGGEEATGAGGHGGDGEPGGEGGECGGGREDGGGRGIPGE